MQTLRQGDVQGPLADDELVAHLGEIEQDHAVRSYATHLIRHVWRNQADIDGRIASSAPNWELGRISPVERNSMRVATAELLLGEVPPKVAMNEAIEIAREYGGQDSPRFVNGVLNQVLASVRPDSVRADVK